MSAAARCTRLTLLLLALLLPMSSLAQEATPTETPTATLAETPTASPTETPLPTATEMATLTPTPEPTLEPTASLTASPTETAVTETLTETATPSLTPSLTLPAPAALPIFPTERPLSLLFSDSFDTGDLSRWTFGAGWSLVASEGGQALQSLNTDEPITSAQVIPGEGAAQARFLFETGAVRLTLRQSEVGNYTATLDTNGTVSLFRSGQLVTTTTISRNQPGQWRTLRLSAVGNDLRVAVDSVDILNALEVSPLPPGVILIAGLGAGTLTVDEVQAWVITNGEQPESETALQPEALDVLPNLAFITPTPISEDGSSAPDLINSIPPGEPGGEACIWFHFSAANATELTSVMNQLVNVSCAVVWLTGTDYVIDTNYPLGYTLFTLVYKNIWFIHEETSTTPATIRVGPSVTNFPRLFYVDHNSQLTLINVNIENFGLAPSIPEAARGGAIYSDNFVRLYRTTFTNNRGSEGGAIGSLGTLKIWNSSFNNNQAIYGGAIENLRYTADPSQVGNMEARCVTFQGNSAQNGGALMALPGGATTTINNSNFVSNNNPDGLSRAFFNSSTNPTANANGNWWGSPIGPSGGQTVSGPISTVSPLPALVDINGAGCPRPAELVIPAASVTLQGPWGSLQQAVVDAVNNTAGALAFQSTSNDTPAAALQRIIQPVTFVRGSLPDGPVCKTNTTASTITCDPNNQTTVYTLVHELGHMFIWRSGGQVDGSNSLFDLLQDVASVKGQRLDEQRVVFGVFAFRRSINGPDDWYRGADGWGDAAVTPWDCSGTSGSVPFDFQQNPCDDQVMKSSREIEEAGADMFLNWVYPSDGFLNNFWTGHCYPSGCGDEGHLTGTTRRNWMNQAMTMIFTNRSWN